MMYPGHGQPVPAPTARLGELLAHRRAREAQVIACLQAGCADVDTITGQIYADLPLPLQRAAARNVLSHLLDLAARGQVTAHPAPRRDAIYQLA